MPWLGRSVASPIIKSAKLKPNSFKASTQEEIPRKKLFKKEEGSWKNQLVISLINDRKYPLIIIPIKWLDQCVSFSKSLATNNINWWTIGQLIWWVWNWGWKKFFYLRVVTAGSRWNLIWAAWLSGGREAGAIKMIKGTDAGWMERVRVSAKGGYCITVQIRQRLRQRQTKRWKKMMDRIYICEIYAIDGSGILRQH